MPTRRFFNSCLFAAALFAANGALPHARAQSPQQATAFVKQTADELLGVINVDAPEAQKTSQMRQIVDRRVDVNGVARFCLGRYWRLATPQQQQEYLQLFHTVLVESITGKLGAYKGVTYTIGRVQPQDGAVSVPTVLQRPNQPPTNVSWVVQEIDGSLRIVDVIAEGTSMRITQRADYAAFIQHNGEKVPALLDAMRRQAERAAG
jgi:phospholipid transport system substrate-binding protein